MLATAAPDCLGMHALCAPLPHLCLPSAETAKSDDAILLKLEEDFTCPITQVSLASTAPCLLCVTALNITSLWPLLLLNI